MKIRLILIFIFLFSLGFNVHAIYDPMAFPNNKYGIHIADVNDLDDAADLVNSNGGDWGYVTVVISEADRNSGKWSDVFNQMRRRHLIPLVRLATTLNQDTWRVPEDRSLDDWTTFLTSLNWPVKNRYIILFNEPNHAKEWGGKLDPESYAQVFVNFARRLKNVSADFFIIPAGLDASAPNSRETMDESVYLRQMIASQPDMLTLMDGWASHSYPNPAFSGSPLASGKGTLRTFIWEKSYLSDLGLTKSLPIFITETGWVHSQGKSNDYSLLDPETVSDYIVQAASSVWSDSQVVAVTPFILNYQDYPFDHFSWRKFGQTDFYEHYYGYLSLPKVTGLPKQDQKYQVLDEPLGEALVANSWYLLTFELKNSGQNILNMSDGYSIRVDSSQQSPVNVDSFSLPDLEPGRTGIVSLTLETHEPKDAVDLNMVVGKGDDWVSVIKKKIDILKPISLNVYTELGWKKDYLPKTAKLLIYDANENIVQEYPTQISNNQIQIAEIKNIIPGKKYRLVVVTDGYLPRQAFTTFENSIVNVQMKRLLPIDLDSDGKLSLHDLELLIQISPFKIFEYIF